MRRRPERNYVVRMGSILSWASSVGRRRNMQAIRSRDTGPEMAIRRILYAAGLRYRVHYAPLWDLRRTADIVFTKKRIAVMIDGCFWHGCPEHNHAVRTNALYWNQKLASNVVRDSDTNKRLVEAGWTVLRFWEHENPDEVSATIIMTLRNSN
jgi:DNA mismatch endonuclease (patch repair protein)